jgi:hypothetical protein
VREETQQYPICVYCQQPITEKQLPAKGMPSGEKAHLACYIEHMDDEAKKPGRLTRPTSPGI